ncbi:disease resistance RPP13-like protein 4 [Argentina anserina]|uniref:disease resistance RPP13-like protein 4 n=1 Tax=Argentina anserina TaxID=57926 RepID=UPI00217658A0|nr:disease resistance RPP13-like protein 4 [Potentilla anserina]
MSASLWSRDPDKFMPKLLNHLSKARAVAAGTEDEALLVSFKKMEEQLENIKGVLPRVKHWEQTLVNQFTNLERRLDKILLGTETSVEAITATLNRMFQNVEQIKVSYPLVQLMPSPERSSEPTWRHRSQPELSLTDREMSPEWSELGLETWVDNTRGMEDIKRSYEHLESVELKMCCLSLSIFPPDSVIKKRPLIYWWIGECFVTTTQDRTAEETGEEIFRKLITSTTPPTHSLRRRALLSEVRRLPEHTQVQPHNAISSVAANSCTVHPWVRHMLVSLAKHAKLFDFDSRWPRMPSYKKDSSSSCRRACLVYDNPIPQGANGRKVEDLMTVFNVNEQYLILKREWLKKLKRVEVIQLGRWQNLASHHIEVEDEGFLKGLGAQNKLLKYLSLRGILGITKLPSSILKLLNLEILDLRACHSLETLPPDISPLRNLTHFDISECYLLEAMPKGIEKLSSLQVLKGFVIGDLEGTPCRIGDLAQLRHLKRLSIHMGNQAEVQKGEFHNLKDIVSLRHLKLSWGVVSPNLKAKVAFQSLEFSFPPDLEKLDLQGIPLAHVPEWLNPVQLKKLKKLYIRGGEFDSLDHGETDKWTVEVLRLKHLNNLIIDLPKLKDEFPRLRYLEKINCHEIEKDRYDANIIWSEDAGYNCV